MNHRFWILIGLLALCGRAWSDDIVCESIGKAYKRCPADTRYGVELVDRLSRSSCDPGRSWGYDAQGIWVDRGCRARFRTGRDPYSGGDDYHGGGYSNDDRAVQACQGLIADRMRREQGAGSLRFDHASIRALGRDLVEVSGAGNGQDHRYQSASFSYRCEVDGRWNRVEHADYQLGGSDLNTRAVEVLCESHGRRYQQCSLDGPADVTLIQQLSKTKCVQGRTWGTDNQGIWVDGGCRARFAVDYRSGFRPGDESGGWPGWEPVVVCQEEIQRSVRQNEGGRTTLAFATPEIRNETGSQVLVYGQAEMRRGRSRNVVIQYACRADSDRRYLLSAEYEEARSPEQPAPVQPAPRPPGNALPPVIGGAGPVDVQQAKAICQDYIAEQVRGERGTDKEVIWGVVYVNPDDRTGQTRVWGRGGTFYGRKRDATFNIECEVDSSSGRILTYGFSYD